VFKCSLGLAQGQVHEVDIVLVRSDHGRDDYATGPCSRTKTIRGPLPIGYADVSV
jgi:hypothetical protein